jgi:DNA-binding HxlR family transcriptional regulator
MSPLNINILLHVYAIVADYRDAQLNSNHARSEAVSQTFEHFAEEGLIEKIIPDHIWQETPADARSSQYTITEKGRAMVEAICSVQIPICKWVQP